MSRSCRKNEKISLSQNGVPSMNPEKNHPAPVDNIGAEEVLDPSTEAEALAQFY
jgi:hypothetical protein